MMRAVTVTNGEEARKGFAEELLDLRADVIRLAALVTEAIAAGTQALLDADLRAAERVVEQDAGIDALAYAIEDHCVVLLARQQPPSADLRTVLPALRTVQGLERSGSPMTSFV